MLKGVLRAIAVIESRILDCAFQSRHAVDIAGASNLSPGAGHCESQERRVEWLCQCAPRKRLWLTDIRMSSSTQVSNSRGKLELMSMTTLKVFITDSGRSPLPRKWYTGSLSRSITMNLFEPIREAGENQYLPKHGRYVFFNI